MEKVKPFIPDAMISVRAFKRKVPFTYEYAYFVTSKHTLQIFRELKRLAQFLFYFPSPDKVRFFDSITNEEFLIDEKTFLKPEASYYIILRFEYNFLWIFYLLIK